MKQLFIGLLIFTQFLFAQVDLSDTNRSLDNSTLPIESDLYLSLDDIPSKIYKGQIFTIRTKVINANQEYSKLIREIGDFSGLKILQTYPDSNKSDYTTLDTYYFQAIEKRIKTPDLFYKLRRGDLEVNPVKLEGKYLSTLELNTDEEFCGVLANDFKIKSSNAIAYDPQSNIIIFSAEADMANITDFNISSAIQQGFYSSKYLLPKSKMTYYLVLPKHLRKFTFSYFNMRKTQYERLSIPIEVHDDSVSTQMDLAPTQYNHTFAKVVIASLIALVGVILYFITRKKRFFFIIALSPLIYIIWSYFPKSVLCVKPDANVYLLPMKNGTIFNKSGVQQHLTKLGKVDIYNKVQLSNQNIGWIKDEDLCED